ncbi:MAG: hypothetical protein AAB967_04330, partial [Patescibacteria group bacterium]
PAGHAIFPGMHFFRFTAFQDKASLVRFAVYHYIRHEVKELAFLGVFNADVLCGHFAYYTTPYFS